MKKELIIFMKALFVGTLISLAICGILKLATGCASTDIRDAYLRQGIIKHKGETNGTYWAGTMATIWEYVVKTEKSSCEMASAVLLQDCCEDKYNCDYHPLPVDYSDLTRIINMFAYYTEVPKEYLTSKYIADVLHNGIIIAFVKYSYEEDMPYNDVIIIYGIRERDSRLLFFSPRYDGNDIETSMTVRQLELIYKYGGFVPKCERPKGHDY